MSLQSVVACRSVKDFSDPALDLIERTYTESFPEVVTFRLSAIWLETNPGLSCMLYQKKTGMSASSPVGFLTVILMWSILQLIRRPVMEE